MKFAKIYEMENGGQVLVKAYFEKGEGIIDLETILPNGVTAKVTNKVRYNPKETEEDLIDKVRYATVVPMYYHLCQMAPMAEEKGSIEIREKF